MDVNFRFLGPDEGGVLTEAIEAAYGTTYDVRWVYDQAEVSARLGRRQLRLLRRRDGGRGAALPHGDEPGGGRRRGRPLGPGGDAGGRPRPAPLHPHQALPDGLGAGPRAWPGCSARRPPPTPTASGRTSSSARTRPASCSAGSRPRSATTPPPGRRAGGSRRRSSTPSSTTATSAASTRPSATTRSSARPWPCASCGGRWPSRGPEAELAEPQRAARRGRRRTTTWP